MPYPLNSDINKDYLKEMIDYYASNPFEIIPRSEIENKFHIPTDMVIAVERCLGAKLTLTPGDIPYIKLDKNGCKFSGLVPKEDAYKHFGIDSVSR